MSIRAFESFQSISNSPELGFHEIKRHHATRGKAGKKRDACPPTAPFSPLLQRTASQHPSRLEVLDFRLWMDGHCPARPVREVDRALTTRHVHMEKHRLGWVPLLSRVCASWKRTSPSASPTGLLRKRSAIRKHGDAGLLFAPSLLVESSVLFGAK